MRGGNLHSLTKTNPAGRHPTSHPKAPKERTSITGNAERACGERVYFSSFLAASSPLMQVGRRAFTGGGLVNHVLFWNCMAKNGTEIDPKGALIKAIDKVHAMRKTFKSTLT